jgi:hypothetical protein
MNVSIEKNITTLVVSALGVIVVLALAYGIFSYYKNSLSQQAHEAFVQRYADFEKTSADANPPSQDLINAVSQDYAQYKNSAYGSFFLALQAELQQRAGNKQDALATMDKAIADMSSADSVLYHTYATKHALMQIDSIEPSVQTKGRQKLEKLAYMSKNPVRDMALYYMGYQAFIDNDAQGVQAAWGKLFDANQNPTSLWGMRALQLRNYTA